MASENGRPAKRARLEYTEGIEVLVGDTEVKFMVHKNVVVKHSRFFCAALQHECKEKDEQRVRLPECCPETFDRYLRWIYNGTFEMCDQPDAEKIPNALHRLVELFILADRLRDIKLCNAIIDELRSNNWWGDVMALPDTFNLAYHALPSSSKLRQLLVDALVSYNHHFHCSDDCDVAPKHNCVGPPCNHPRRKAGITCIIVEWLDNHKDSLPVDLLVDLAKAGALREHRKHPEPDSDYRPCDRMKLGKCFYHEHNNEVPKMQECLVGRHHRSVIMR